MTTEPRPFSWAWVGVSVVVFTAWELVLGGFISELLEARFTSHMLRLRLETVLSLGAYLGGGFTVGVISPGVRLAEPAVAAALSVALTFLISVLTPLRLYQIGGVRLVVGAVLAAAIGAYGAHLGEKLTGN